MKKVVLLSVVAFAGMFMSATAQKLGHINTTELLIAMPETKKAQEKLQKMQDSLNTSYAELIKEYREKDSLIRADSAKWTPARKEIKFKEFQDLGESLQNYSTAAQQYLQQKEQEMFEPLQRIAREAITAVAKANGYAYVFSEEALLVSPPGDDLLPLVKKHLKIPDAPPAAPKK
ncbi:MAG TPA: OmpH family outer membrane protein [Lacibacter sp.]|nr:OmpH family outer membrane protein [Lacibacter sp.]HMO88582.1 OmpH family outer membrane protein [Lacibacter sp.]HMP86118.1 OmpH family outer membrane protein [Lacibacter sp.]